ncbi:hypothetical protein [Halomonas sp. WWR20]
MQRRSKIMGAVALVTLLTGMTGAYAQQGNSNDDFGFWDTDDSGDISREEWDGGIAETNTDVQDGQVGDTGGQGENALYNTYKDYNSIDENKDSMIDPQEFERFRNNMREE